MLKWKDLVWENCLALGSDNAAVMGGKKKGVYGLILRKNECMLCCLLLSSSPHRCLEENKVLPVSPDDTLVDICYHLKHSSR